MGEGPFTLWKCGCEHRPTACQHCGLGKFLSFAESLAESMQGKYWRLVFLGLAPRIHRFHPPGVGGGRMRVTGLVLRILPTTDGLVCREQESNAEWFFGTELEGTGLGSRRKE